MASLEQRHLLLVLDNCEHLIEAVAALADRLLRSCPGVRLLATSREPLCIRGETIWRVPSLGVPDRRDSLDLDQVARSPAVQLFVARAQAVDRQFDLTPQNARVVAEVCARLDGLPLALELAAAMLRVLGMKELRQRLDDRFHLLASWDRTAPPRHRTLQATLEWSHQLLSPAEQVVFRRLAVFAGGWSLEAAETVCSGAPVDCGDVLGALSGLVDKSLVLMQDACGVARYRLLDTIHQYSQHKLYEAGEAALVQRRHATWCLSLVDQAAPHIQTPDEKPWLARLVIEPDNLRLALAWCETHREAASNEMGLRLVDGLRDLWLNRGQHAEGRAWFERMLATTSGPPSRLRARVLGWAAQFAGFQHDIAHTERRGQQAVRMAHDLGDTDSEVHALVTLGNLARTGGDLAAAQSLTEQASQLGRTLGDVEANWRTLSGLGQLFWQRGELDRAQALIEESLAMATRRGDAWGRAHSLHLLGNVQAAGGETAQATTLLEASLAAWQAIDADYGRHWLLLSLGRLVHRQGDSDRARALLGESLRLCRQTGDRIGIARCLDGLAGVAATTGQAARAVRLLAASDTLRAQIATPRQSSEQPAYERTLAAARAALSRPADTQAETEGRTLRLEEAIADAAAFATVGGGSTGADRAQRAGPLTARQLDVLRLVAEGKTDRQIAGELVLSDKTVGRHLENIFTRLGVSSRAAATVVAVRDGLV